jgi:hypothetical protein
VNVGSRAHYIDAGGGAYCPLIKGIALIRAGSWTWSLVAQAHWRSTPTVSSYFGCHFMLVYHIFDAAYISDSVYDKFVIIHLLMNTYSIVLPLNFLLTHASFN